MNYVFQPPSVPAVPVAQLEHETQRFFPVHRIYCVARNYAEHAREMGFAEREDPFFFIKPADAILPIAAGTIGGMEYPSHTQNLHHEVELVVALGENQSIWGYAIGLDMTRRDLQLQAKQHGRPWSTAKGFDQSAPIGPIYPHSRVGELTQGEISLSVNGLRRQNGDIAQMLWKVREIIEHLSGFFKLRAGDLIFTGTPAGVGPVVVGDVLQASIAGLGELQFKVI